MARGAPRKALRRRRFWPKAVAGIAFAPSSLRYILPRMHQRRRPTHERSHIQTRAQPMKINVLLVDDSAVMRRLLRNTLEITGIELGAVYEAANGAAALELLERERVDLMLLDI